MCIITNIFKKENKKENTIYNIKNNKTNDFVERFAKNANLIDKTIRRVYGSKRTEGANDMILEFSCSNHKSIKIR